MTREQAERKIEAKKQFISILSEEMQEAIEKYKLDEEYWQHQKSRARLKGTMKMLRRETIALEKLMYNWYEMEV